MYIVVLADLSASMEFLREILNAAREQWIIVTLLLLVILIYWLYQVNYTVLKKLGLPGPPPLPLTGNAMGFIWNAKTWHEVMRKERKMYGKVYGLYLLKTPTIVVSDPEIVKVILVKEFEKFHDRPVSIFNYAKNDAFTRLL